MIQLYCNVLRPGYTRVTNDSHASALKTADQCEDRIDAYRSSNGHFYQQVGQLSVAMWLPFHLKQKRPAPVHGAQRRSLLTAWRCLYRVCVRRLTWVVECHRHIFHPVLQPLEASLRQSGLGPSFAAQHGPSARPLAVVRQLVGPRLPRRSLCSN